MVKLVTLVPRYSRNPTNNRTTCPSLTLVTLVVLVTLGPNHELAPPTDSCPVTAHGDREETPGNSASTLVEELNSLAPGVIDSVLLS